MFGRGYIKDLQQIYIIEFLTSFYFPKAIIILFFLAKSLTLAQVGLIGTVTYATNLLLEYPSGIFADKYGRKMSLQIAHFAMVISMIAYALAPGLKTMLLGSFLWGISWSFYSGSNEALIYDSLKKLNKEKLNKEVIGLTHTIGFAGMIIAMYVGHALYSINPTYPFFAGAIAYFLAIPVLATFKEPPYRSKESLEFKKAFKDGIELIFKKRTLLFLFIFAATMFLFEHAWYNTDQALLIRAGLPESLLSTYYLIGSVLGMIGGVVLPKIVEKLKVKQSIMLVIILQVIGLAFISVNNVWIIAVFSYFLLISHTLWGYTDADMVHQHIPSRIRATALSGRQLMLSAVYVFNPWVMAYLVQTFGRSVFAYFGTIALITGFIVLLIFRNEAK